MTGGAPVPATLFRARGSTTDQNRPRSGARSRTMSSSPWAKPAEGLWRAAFRTRSSFSSGTGRGAKSRTIRRRRTTSWNSTNSGSDREHVLELRRGAWVAELAEGLGLDLPDALAREVELLADLLQGARLPRDEPETQRQHPSLTLGEKAENAPKILLAQDRGGRLEGRLGFVVGDEVRQLGVLLVAHGLVQREGLGKDPKGLLHLLGFHVRRLRDLVDGGLAIEPVEEVGLRSADAIEGLDHVHGDADRPPLVRDGTGYRLADPPRGVGRELEPSAPVELLDRPDETKVAFLNEVEQRQAGPRVLLRDRDHQPEVRLNEAALRRSPVLELALESRPLVCGRPLERLEGRRGLLALLDRLGQLDLLDIGKERVATDLVQILAKQVLMGAMLVSCTVLHCDCFCHSPKQWSHAGPCLCLLFRSKRFATCHPGSRATRNATTTRPGSVFLSGRRLIGLFGQPLPTSGRYGVDRCAV